MKKKHDFSCMYTFSLLESTIPPISLATNTIRPYVCSATSPTALSKKLKIAPATLPIIAGNASTALTTNLLREIASLFTNFVKAPLSFGRDNAENKEDICNNKCNCWNGHRKSSKYWHYCNTLPTEQGKSSFQKRFIFIKDLFNGLFDAYNLFSKTSSFLW